MESHNLECNVIPYNLLVVKKLTNGSLRPTAQIPANMPDFPLFVR